MESVRPHLDSLTFEVRYAYGHTYLDRCGQTLVDIERLGQGWVTSDANPNGGHMENSELGATLTFDVEKFSLTETPASDVPALAEACTQLWSVVQANLALSEFVRIACRLQWLKACKAIDQAESVLRNLPLNITVPTELKKYPLKRRSLVVVLEAAEKTEYRVALQTVTRTQGVAVSSLVTTEPRFLPRNRRAARLAMIKRRAEYDANPQHAVLLDVDCVAFEPEQIDPMEFISRHHRIAMSDFLPLLEER